MSYVRDNGLARARKRRERRALTILAVCGLLVVGSIVFAMTFISTPKKQAGPCPHGTAGAPAPESAGFTLNVYNAGGPKGVAGSTAEAMKSHQLTIGSIGNDPYRAKLDGTAQVRFGPEGASMAKKYVAPLVSGAVLVDDGRDGSSVDLVVGSQAPSIASAPASSSPKPVCKP